MNGAYTLFALQHAGLQPQTEFMWESETLRGHIQSLVACTRFLSQTSLSLFGQFGE